MTAPIGKIQRSLFATAGTPKSFYAVAPTPFVPGVIPLFGSWMWADGSGILWADGSRMV